MREARIDRGTNHVQVRGTVQLPKTTAGFRRTPGDLAPEDGRAEFAGTDRVPAHAGDRKSAGQRTIKTDNSIARLELTAQGDLIGFGNAAAKSLSAKISATKKLPATDATEEPFYANLIRRFTRN